MEWRLDNEREHDCGIYGVVELEDLIDHPHEYTAKSGAQVADSGYRPMGDPSGLDDTYMRWSVVGTVELTEPVEDSPHESDPPDAVRPDWAAREERVYVPSFRRHEVGVVRAVEARYDVEVILVPCKRPSRWRSAFLGGLRRWAGAEGLAG